ncbi:MAG: prolyl-tRNA synthetase [Parcubacteria group bacterium GW2011_GWA2_56_7]|nr:MAG: prolyl-tRNA synthetase [Parcubacteria group bacterium GW2011_GWA2_56_7]
MAILFAKALQKQYHCPIMRYSQLFGKTTKTAPADETATNAQLLLKAGFIYKEMAGVYAYLPLGLRVTENIKRIIREEMNAVGGQEMIMTTLQRKELWEKTDRWSDEAVDIWFKASLKNGAEVGLAWSHEEPITDMVKNYVGSYRDLPFSIYQFQNKLRNETRAKSGIMRTREFVMKDLYSYARNDEEHQAIYDAMTQAYLRVFDRVGLGEHTYFTFASGGAFTQFSHEFQTVTPAGEDTIYVHRERRLAVNKEVLTDEVLAQLGLVRDELEEVSASEVGNIFSFGTTKSEQLGLMFTDEDGKTKPVVLGSYGIGIGRLMGVIVEHYADERGMVWPKSVAPALVHLVSLKSKDEGVTERILQTASSLHDDLENLGIEVIWDERDASPGEKFADADLIGLPLRLVISEKTLKEDSVEWKLRASEKMQLVKLEDAIEEIQTFVAEE